VRLGAFFLGVAQSFDGALQDWNEVAGLVVFVFGEKVGQGFIKWWEHSYLLGFSFDTTTIVS
jgi:hypothetical protein